jgi:hypothetical protein
MVLASPSTADIRLEPERKAKAQGPSTGLMVGVTWARRGPTGEGRSMIGDHE